MAWLDEDLDAASAGGIDRVHAVLAEEDPAWREGPVPAAAPELCAPAPSRCNAASPEARWNFRENG